MARKLTAGGFALAARRLAPDAPQAEAHAILSAVIAVEARSSGFDKQGRVLILYEPHVAWRVCSANRKAAKTGTESLRWIAVQRDLEAAGLAYPKWGTRPYPRDSWPRFLAARKIDAEVAARACSWGLGQILGENFEAAGYASAEEMGRAFQEGEDEQLAAMVSFILANPAMHRALLAKDWAEFARRYNGPGYAKNRYHIKLAQEYARALKKPLALPPAQAGATQQDRAAQAARDAAATIGAAATTGGTAIVVQEPAKAPAGMPLNVKVGLGLGAGLLLAAGLVLIIRAVRSRPAERIITEG